MVKIESGIYQIKNKENNNIYIGQTAEGFKRRKIRHYAMLRGNSHWNQHLQNAWNKYGENNFSFDILERVPCIKELLIEREQFYLDNYNPEYNKCPNAKTTLGLKWPENAAGKETLSNLMSERMTGREPWNKGKKGLYRLSKEHKKKISKGNKGKKQTKSQLESSKKVMFKLWDNGFGPHGIRFIFCEFCGKPKFTKVSNTKYCSSSCKNKTYRIRKKNAQL